MNGETTTYRVNAPMKWYEFKAMPDDLKVLYIGWIRDTYRAPDSAVADMLGVHRTHLSKLLRSLGVEANGRGARAKWDKEGFAAWADISEKAEAALEAEQETENSDVPPALIEAVKNAPIMPLLPERVEPVIELIPTAGWMNFEGPADQALRSIGNVLGGANVRLHVSWEPITTEDDQDGGR